MPNIYLPEPSMSLTRHLAFLLATGFIVACGDSDESGQNSDSTPCAWQAPSTWSWAYRAADRAMVIYDQDAGEWLSYPCDGGDPSSVSIDYAPPRPGSSQATGHVERLYSGGDQFVAFAGFLSEDLSFAELPERTGTPGGNTNREARYVDDQRRIYQTNSTGFGETPCLQRLSPDGSLDVEMCVEFGGPLAPLSDGIALWRDDGDLYCWNPDSSTEPTLAYDVTTPASITGAAAGPAGSRFLVGFAPVGGRGVTQLGLYDCSEGELWSVSVNQANGVDAVNFVGAGDYHWTSDGDVIARFSNPAGDVRLETAMDKTVVARVDGTTGEVEWSVGVSDVAFFSLGHQDSVWIARPYAGGMTVLDSAGKVLAGLPLVE